MKTDQAIAEWMINYLANLLDIDPNQIETNLSFDNFGLDSFDAAQLTAEMSEWLNFDIEISVIYDYPSIDELSLFLCTELQTELQRRNIPCAQQ